VRIAVSGAHGTGKSTLIADLARNLPGYAVAEESYYALVAEGHAFAAQPSREELELLLERSCTTLVANDAPNLLLDRCPADYLGYLVAAPGPLSDVLARWFERASAAMSTLDLVVFVPIEDPDRIDPSAIEHRWLRRRADDALREIVVEDTWGFVPSSLEVSGLPDERVARVLAWISEATPPVPTKRATRR
jgi:adenylate kinase family enzyme